VNVRFSIFFFFNFYTTTNERFFNIRPYDSDVWPTYSAGHATPHTPRGSSSRLSSGLYRHRSVGSIRQRPTVGQNLAIHRHDGRKRVRTECPRINHASRFAGRRRKRAVVLKNTYTCTRTDPQPFIRSVCGHYSVRVRVRVRVRTTTTTTSRRNSTSRLLSARVPTRYIYERYKNIR